MSWYISYLDEVPILLTLFEQGRCLANIRINPDANPQTPFLESFQVAGCIGEHVRVEVEVTPLVGLHPEAVKMEYAQRDISITETVQETGNGFFIVIRREAFEVSTTNFNKHSSERGQEDILVVSQRL